LIYSDLCECFNIKETLVLIEVLIQMPTRSTALDQKFSIKMGAYKKDSEDGRGGTVRKNVGFGS
jgi:hypothetical protein